MNVKKKLLQSTSLSLISKNKFDIKSIVIARRNSKSQIQLEKIRTMVLNSILDKIIKGIHN